MGRNRRGGLTMRIYFKSLIFLIGLLVIIFLPLYGTSVGLFSSSATLNQLLVMVLNNPLKYDYLNVFIAFTFIGACLLILLSGLGIYKKGLRYGNYLLIFSFIGILIELFNLNQYAFQNDALRFFGIQVYPSFAFFGIIIIIYFMSTTNKK